MTSHPERRVVLITGSRIGIGRYLAEYFLSQGGLVVGCSREPSDLSAADYRHFCLDVSSDRDVGAMFLEVRRTFGRLDVLVNNAGVLAASPVVLTARETLDRLFATNLVGVHLCSREAILLMKKGVFGRIINLSSISVPLAPAGSAIYGGLKAALEQYTRVLAKETSALGITVNAIGLPPVADTGMTAALPDAVVAETVARTALGRQVSLAEVAHAVEFLAAERSSAVTGQTLYLGGT